jgi:ABC-type multidrug transport system ATPase subunit
MSSFDYKSEFIPLRTDNQTHDFSGRVEIKNLEFSPSRGIKLLDQVNLTVESGEHLALVGFSGSGKSTLAKCIGQLCNYTKGEILLDGYALSSLSKQEVVNTIGFISQSSFIFSGTVNDNLLYTYHAIDDQPQKKNIREEPNLDDKISVVQQTGLFTDILRFGLNTIIDRSLYPGLEEKILRLRRSFQENFEEELADHVEFFNADRFLYQSSIVENIIFGSPLKPEYAFNQLVTNKPFINFLTSCGLSLPLLETGAEIIRQTIDILGEHPDDELFFAQTPIRSEEYGHCIELSAELTQQTISDLGDSGRSLLLSLALRYKPHAHKIIALQPLLENLVLTGRKAFHTWCSSNDPAAVSFYEADRYISSQSILSNIFYGNLSDNSPAIEERVNQCIVFLLVQEDLLEQIAAIGMEFDVGNKGDRLSGGQQQKLAIARVLLKHPKILIMDEATSALDNDSQRRIQRIVESWKGQCTVIAVIHRLDMLPSFDKVAVMKAGKIVECGEPDELTSRKGVLNELLHGKRH